MILDDIVKATQRRVEISQAARPLEEIRSGIKRKVSPFLFEKALRQEGLSFICEIKKASPSKGILAESFPYLEIAAEYEKAGASAISVLTEPDYFLGKLEYLKEIKKTVSVPVLQKDFILGEYQVYEAAQAGADAILLICSILSGEQIRNLIIIADELGLSCLVETHDEREIRVALDAGARIIGVNNRDLKTFHTDLSHSDALRQKVPSEVVFVSESGIRTAEDVNALRVVGADAVLIGETLMKSTDKAMALRLLRGDLI